MEVNRILGSGFLEKVYESALAVELSRAGLAFEQQKPISVLYKEIEVGEYFCDFIVNDRLILELKALNVLAPEHEAQVLNYLRATGLKAALLLNFGRTRLGIRRLVLEHDDNNPI